uniref:Uncharacterized protein n=1 Tax=Polytomella parva TaxID=51329 RepID=A0A7S0YQK8_9CHLO|mmetsp:Transcript_8044/g.15614  ORF Transcript_8044/g.15614 Transcript_8044/m.15614 type:complete len:411 (+) Transcript_8044:173-1405(+)
MVPKAFRSVSFKILIVLLGLLKSCYSETAVIYHLINAYDPHISNFVYFLREGILKGNTQTYLLSPETRLSLESKVRKFPSFVTHIKVPRSTSCTAYRDVLDRNMIPIGSFTYFFFIDSTVAGPFIPSHLASMVSWREVFTSRINHKVKMVGNAISCASSKPNSNVPHLYDNFFVTDSTGLAIIREGQAPLSLQSGAAASCSSMSQFLFDAGYSIDSLLTRYQGINWQDKRNWHCNHNIDPFGPYRYDGATIDPFEVVFYPYDETILNSYDTDVMKVKKYMLWRSGSISTQQRIESNEQLAHPSMHSFLQILYETARGKDCLDRTYCRNRKVGACEDEGLWKNYVYMEQFDRTWPDNAFRCKLVLDRSADGTMKFRRISTRENIVAHKEERDKGLVKAKLRGSQTALISDA